MGSFYITLVVIVLHYISCDRFTLHYITLDGIVFLPYHCL